jgi:hypothetical protein
MAPVKTTLDIPDDLFRQAKSHAALTGMKLKDLVAAGLRSVLTGSIVRSAPRRAQFPIIEARPGAPVITKQRADEAEELTLKEEARHHAKLMRR